MTGGIDHGDPVDRRLPERPDRPGGAVEGPPATGELLAGGGVARPRSLVVAAVVGSLAAALLLVEAATPGARAVGSGYVVYLLVAAAVEGSCVLGIWLRRRWGLMGYGSFFPFHQIILAAAGTWGPIGFVLRAVILTLALRNARHLR